MSSSSSDVRVVVGIDFGTTYSGYAYAHKSNPNEIIAQDSCRGHLVHGIYKIPTVISYDDDSYTNVNSWGFSALAAFEERRSPSTSKPIELFKLLLLGNVLTDKLSIPDKLDYKKVTSDYLKELCKDVKKTIESHWRLLDFYENVMIVLTVPAEFNDNAISILRECAFNAELIKEKDSRNLIFTTEPEAAAIHSMYSLKKEHNLKPGDSFMIVDCGGGTVDLTTRELTEDDKLLEITERSGDFCGSCFIDKEFVEFLGKNIGKDAIDNLRENRYTNLQYLVQEFSDHAKIPFTGQSESFETFNIDLEYEYKVIKEYIEDEKKKGELDEKEWMIEVKFDDVKKMFDPIIERIFKLIRGQLEQLKRCNKKVSVILLVGGFGGSKYLQARIKDEFTTEVSGISVSTQPIVAIMKGAVKYGLEKKIVKSRILKWTYGTDVVRKWQPTDPLSQKLPNGYIKVFEILAKRGKQVSLSDKVIKYFKPYSIQRKMGFNMYVTLSNSAEYFNNNSEIKLLREWEIKMNSSSGLDDYDEDDDVISLSLGFGQVEICATAENSKTGDKHEVTFKQDFD
ncbi:hypothetical protein Glove_243g81 [Diversispora epigaea]|uniref:Actin-like ATPase domain-containing protein n=1 Tax=Diversispora epigaea TaxID=1348612 RepID=A0A397IFW4_9GLOM|nr:hypothetical protein Glove_243g81 [Diversispora epigaea]